MLILHWQRVLLTKQLQEGFASASDSALLPYEIAAPNFNQLYQNLKASGRNDFVGAVTLINSMKASNDPRISAYYQPTKSGEYIGAPIGITASFATQSHIGMFGYTPIRRYNINLYRGGFLSC